MGSFDGIDAAPALAAALHVPRVALFGSVTSTMDEADRLAGEGAPAGTVIIADEQTGGRGRTGKKWVSRANQGVWMSVIERPATASGLDVLSLRLGLRVAPVLEYFAGTPVLLKWPNDLYTSEGKLAGLLVEARWRDDRVEWVTIGIGVNILPPHDVPGAAGLRTTTRRRDLISALVPELREATAVGGPLSLAELSEFSARDMALGKRCVEPARGRVRGITSDGALSIEGENGISHYRRGSLQFEGAPA